MSNKESAVKAVGFESRCIYDPPHPPHYACWTCLFPGERGQWYVAFEEVKRPENPLPKCSPEQWYAMGLPTGYDKSQFLMEAVILESTDKMESWREVSRKAYRFHHTVGSYGGTGRTKDGKFLRFLWSTYCFDASLKPNEILEVSEDNGKTWINKGPFHDDHFAGHPHKLRMLKDGTFVLALPLNPRFGTSECPVRTCSNLNAIGENSMTMWYSFDQGQSWQGPLPIFAGQTVSETDFVELPSGNLLFINNSIFAFPGRQIIYRDGNKFTPGAMERAKGNTGMPDDDKSSNLNTVPEAVCLTDDGILVGCMRPGYYYFSDDLGKMWYPLPGTSVPGSIESKQVYQPSMHYLGDGQVACTGHFGYDDPIVNNKHNTLHLHLFKVNILRKTKNTSILVERDYNESIEKWPNAYTLTLLCENQPLPNKKLEFWYAERYKPGYDTFGKHTLQERMAVGGEIINVITDNNGKARVKLPHMDKVEDPHLCYQFVVMFNSDGSDLNFKPAQSLQYSSYANLAPDKAL